MRLVLTRPTYLVLLIAAVVVVAACSSGPQTSVSNPTCGDGPLLSVYPTDLAHVPNINPLGNLQPPGHTFPTSHMYFAIEPVLGEAGEGPFGDGKIFPPHPVYAVADGEIVRIEVTTVTTSSDAKVAYAIDLAVCEDLRIRYGDIGPASDPVLAELAGLSDKNCDGYFTGEFPARMCWYTTQLEVVAGEQIGLFNGQSTTLDMSAYEFNIQNVDFLHPELYGQEANGSVCLLDLYAPDKRAAMIRLLGDSKGSRTADPICGVLNYTIPGTLQGNWFKELKSFIQEGANIAFVYDEVRPDVPVISIGYVPDIPSLAYNFEPRDQGRVNRLFADVEAGAGIFCYQDLRDLWRNPSPATHLLVEVPEAGRLLVRAEDGMECGSGPWEMGAEATEFVR